MRIGFLFNHDQPHQIAHSLPVALTLADMDPGATVLAAATNAILAAEVARLCAAHGASRVVQLELCLNSRVNRGLARLVDPLVPGAKLLVYRDNLDFFRSLDVLVVAEKTSLILKTRYGLNHLRMVYTSHGAGDRAIGFDADTAHFDQLMAAGPKIRDRWIDESGADPAKIWITGYPKFDLAPRAPVRLPLQHNGRPTVLYNPHPSPHLSSWYKQGRAVLDYFLASDRYNLIFAPHIMLFQRKFVITVDRLAINRPGALDGKYREAPHIHIDLGSNASTDMTYTQAADIYLGDVSSQIYEFLIRPRPAVFLNTHRVGWRRDPDYAHWQAGPVIEDVAALDGALERAQAQQATFGPLQTRLFDHTFDLTREPSSRRVASAILAALAGRQASNRRYSRNGRTASTDPLRVRRVR